jgi:hypothetical protein
VDVDILRKSAPYFAQAKQRSRCVRKSATGEIDMNFFGKYEESAPGHASGYERDQPGDKTFQRARL